LRPKTRLAQKIHEKILKEKEKGSKKRIRGRFDQASAPFHEGVLPSQYNLEQSELQRVGRKARRTQW
jgi:hypothetical protein